MNASSEKLHAAADATLAIEQAMRAGNFWHAQIPTPAAMASRAPFCADTLAFSEWLQFVFLPRMRDLIKRDECLPTASAIAVMAEEALDERPGKTALLAQLRAFDKLIETDKP